MAACLGHEYRLGSTMYVLVQFIGGSKGSARDVPPLPRGPNSFILMQFSPKNKLAHQLWELAPPLRKILDLPLQSQQNLLCTFYWWLV